MNAVDADFILIGSGPAGVSAAIPLVDAGHRVLMLDSAGPHETRTLASPWHRALGAGLEALQPDDGLSPKLHTPVAREIVGPFRSYADMREDNFYAIGAHARGGLSRVWGGFVAELDDDDMQGWPFASEALRPSYAAVTSRIGISGSSNDDTASFFGRSGPLMPAPPISPAAHLLLDRYGVVRPVADFSLGMARNALLTADLGQRRMCDLSQSCLWGCERGAIYDASSDLLMLRSRPQFELRDGATVTGLQRSPDGWEVSLRGGDRPLRARRVIVAAGAFGTLKLVLPMIATADTGELPVQSSPVLATPLLLPKRIGSKPPERGYSLAQLGYRLSYGHSAGAYVTGGIYEVTSLPPSSFAARLPFGRRAGTEVFRALAPALLVATTYFPGSCSANRITWRRNNGTFAISISGGVVPELKDIARSVRIRLSRIWRRLGAYTLPGGSFALPGTDAHIGALFPMGTNGRYGTNEFGELHAAAGIHLVDGSVLPNIPSKFTTLTIMANADRIGRHLAASP